MDDKNYNDINNKLFFKLFRNKVIRNRIYYHLNIFNSHKFQREFSYHEIDRYPWKEYLQSVLVNDDEIHFGKHSNRNNNNNNNDNNNRGELKLPLNVTSLAFKELDQEIWEGFIPFKGRENPITYLDLGKKYSSKLKRGDIPYTIKILKLSDCYNSPLTKGDIPDSVEQIIFNNRWNQELTKDSLPNSIKSIYFGNDYNNGGKEFNAACLPFGLESLRFGYSFSQEIVHDSLIKFTPNLKKLQISSNYKYQLTFKQIPSVTELFFGLNTPHKSQYLNYEYKLPEGIKILTLGDNITAPIEPMFIPSSVTELSLGSNNRLVQGSIPNNVRKLDLGVSFARELPWDSLPQSLEHLIFSYDFNSKLLFNQFANTQNLTTIELGATFSRPIEAGVFPNSLTTLKFGRMMNPVYIERNAIPDSVTYLQIMPSFTSTPDNYYNNIPKNLRKLKLINFDREIPIDYFNSDNAPESLKNLKSLSLGDSFNRVIKPGTLPYSLEKLDFGYKFNQPLDDPSILPCSLKSLTLGNEFNKEIKEYILPESLITLKVYGRPKIGIESIKSLPHLNSLICFNTNNEFLKSIDLYYFFSVLKIKKFSYLN